jgi:NADPH2:quinone reductase
VRAVWYERPGPAAEVPKVGELPDPVHAPVDVRVRLTRSGINPGDTRKRAGWVGHGMPFPRIIPDSDAAGALAPVRCAEPTASRS